MDDIITTAIERPGVFLVSFVVPVLMILYIIVCVADIVVKDLQDKRAQEKRAKEYERIFRRK